MCVGGGELDVLEVVEVDVHGCHDAKRGVGEEIGM